MEAVAADQHQKQSFCGWWFWGNKQLLTACL